MISSSVLVAFVPLVVLLVVLAVRFRWKFWMFPGAVWCQIKEMLVEMHTGVSKAEPVRIEDPVKPTVHENAKTKMIGKKEPAEGKPNGYMRV
ncbi:hypothetical protein L0Y69_03065 [bacterium]|nr:hypothetical protein [bacterium]